MKTLLQDLRFGLRMLWKSPAFTLVAVVSLALGIGLNTAIFSVVNVLLIRPVPVVKEQERVMWLRASISYPDYVDYAAQTKSFAGMAAATGTSEFSLSTSGEPEIIKGEYVTGNYFDVLGVGALKGRTFDKAEGQIPTPVVVLSEHLWRTRFDSDPSIIGRQIPINGLGFTVVGVTPKNFIGTEVGLNRELWVPLLMQPGLNPPEAGRAADPFSNRFKERDSHWLAVFARLNPGVSREQAGTELSTVARHVAETYRGKVDAETLRSVQLLRMSGGMDPRDQQEAVPLAGIVMAVVALVLLIACANVANLLLVRAAGRQKEIAVRTALGAGRWRIVRQMITESVLLALVGGALGTLLALWGVEVLVALSAGSLPLTAHVGIDATVLGFTLLVSLMTGVLFGLAPAVRTMKLNLSESLKEGGRSGSEGAHRNRTRSVLVVFESAVAVVLLIGAGLLVRSLLRLQDTSPGFDPRNVLTMGINLPQAKYGEPEKSASFFAELESRVAGLPGVESVGLVSELPLSGQPNDMPYTVEGRPPVSIDQAFDDDFRRVNTNYFRALGIPFLRGRNFTDQEVRQGAKVVIISELLARQVFPNEEPRGKRLIMSFGNQAFEIIGIVGDIRHRALESNPAAAMYMPAYEGSMNVVIRSKGDPASLAAAVRKEVLQIDPNQPVADVRTMEQWLDSSVAGPRYRTTLLGLFALVALALASTGIYGVMSYSVSQRTHEIGVRMALGARRPDVLRLVVRQGMTLVFIGVALGLGGAFALTRLMASLLFEVTAKDPFTFVAVSALLTLVAFVACYLPARRATKVDPLTALRYE